MKKIVFLIFLLLLSLSFVFLSPKKHTFAETYHVELDDTYLFDAAVSDEVITLNATVYDSAYNKVEKEVVYSITSGESYVSLDGDKLIIKDAGIFKVRASLKEDNTVYDEIETYSDYLELSNVEFLNETELTVYTQPFELKIGFDSNITNDTYNEFVFEVVEGPGKIFGGNRLKVLDEGVIKVKATAVYELTGFNKVIEFNVTDPDKVITTTDGCKNSVNSLFFVSVLSVLVIGLFIKRNLSEKKDY